MNVETKTFILIIGCFIVLAALAISLVKHKKNPNNYKLIDIFVGLLSFMLLVSIWAQSMCLIVGIGFFLINTQLQIIRLNQKK